MTISVDVEIKGTEELLRTLQRLEPSLAENGLRQGVNAVAREIVKEARQNLAPHRDTGRLQASLGTSTRIDRRERGVTGKARTRTSGKHDAFYGRFLEFGTIKQQPIAFLGRAAQSVTPRANQILTQRIRTNLPKIVQRAKRRGII